MSSSPRGLRTTDPVQFLLDHGFVPGFARALAQQFAIMDLASTDELTRILPG